MWRVPNMSSSGIESTIAMWKVWSLARLAADWTTSRDAVWSLCQRPTEGLLPYTLEPCRTDNETPVRPTGIWCVQEQKANAVPEAMETRDRSCGLSKWDVLLHWGSTADGPVGTWKCLQESHFHNPSATARVMRREIVVPAYWLIVECCVSKQSSMQRLRDMEEWSSKFWIDLVDISLWCLV